MVAGIEREQLEQVARDCGGIAVPCDVRHRDEVEAAVSAAVDRLGGLDVVIANAGVAAQLPIDGGDPEIFERTIDVNSLRVELASTGARVGVAYFGELDTDMTRRGFGTEAAAAITRGPQYVAPLRVGVDAIARGVIRRSRRVTAPGYVAPLLPVRMMAQRVVDLVSRRGLDRVLEIARDEHAPLTTPQP